MTFSCKSGATLFAKKKPIVSPLETPAGMQSAVAIVDATSGINLDFKHIPGYRRERRHS